jgi:hypothetical protein
VNLYWLVELDAAGTAIRTLAVVGEDGERRSYQLLSTAPDIISESAGSAPVMMVDVDVDVVVPWAGHRLALVPVATPPLTADLDEAVADLAARVAATMMEAS